MSINRCHTVLLRWVLPAICAVLWMHSGIAQESVSTSRARAQRFLAGRSLANGGHSADAMHAARQQHADMLAAQFPTSSARLVPADHTPASPRLNPLNAAWQPVGPAQIASQRYGLVTGRVSSVAIDPADSTGNTVYLGTTGGGVWKSTNAAGPAAGVAFAPLTDTLPVFSANGGGVAIPSLSIGAVSVGNGVILAGTGDPNDATDSYYGEGVLRSTDGGATWTLIQQSLDNLAGNHSFTGLGIAGFAWSTTMPSLVVMAVSQAAEGVIVNAPDATNSVMGLYYSVDSGVTWQMGLILDGLQVVQRPQPTGANLGGNAATSVVWNPIRQRFYAAVRFHGYYESPDGLSWTRLAHQPGTGITLAACPTNPNAIGNPNCPVFRGALAVQPATGDTFALTVDSNNFDQGLWQDVCALSGNSCVTTPIAFATRLASTPLEAGNGSTAIPQADYNLTLAAVGTGSGPTATTVLYAGTVDLYRCSLLTGCALRNTTNAANGCSAPALVAPAQHGIAVLAGGGTGGLPLVYFGNDGGLWRSRDGVNQQQTPCSADDATHFENLNGGLGSLAEVVSFGQHPTDPQTLLVGMGANGTAATGAASTIPAWPQIAAGEGGTVAIDPVNPMNWYVSTAAGVSLRYCSKGTACSASDFAGAPTIGYGQVAGDSSLIDPPFLLDPALTTNVLIGTCRAWRGPAQSAVTWPGGNAISTLFGGPQNAACSPTANSMVRSLGAGGPASGVVVAQDAGSTVLYAGMAGTLDGGRNFAGHVFATSSAGSASTSTVWTDIARSPVTNDVADAGLFNPGGFDISSVTVDPHDSTGKTLYVTIMGFAGNGTNAPHLYRTIDGGAHWTNISSNLPNAPANSLVIDPNDANTLYVALDTGIYVTTSVTSCTAANCWSSFGTGLPNAPVIQLAAAPGMATGDGRHGELRAATYGRGIWAIPLLTAAFPSTPSMSLNPSGLTFAVQAVATASPQQTILFTNTGNITLTVTQVTATGDFIESDNCVTAPIAVGGTCSVQVMFLPTGTGPRSGILTVYANVPGGQGTTTLTGAGAPAAAIVLNPINVTYAVTNLGATSAAQNITISNTGAFSATLQTPTVTGDFLIGANTCGTSLPGGVGCTVSVVFKPTASGARTGSFTVTDSVGTQTASLAGTGVLPATDALAPLGLTFAPQQLNTASATQQVTLTNSGDVALTLIAGTITSGDFTVVNSCGNSLNGHSSCSMLVAFVPTAVGTRTGVLTVSDTYRSQTVALNGTGVAPPGVSLSPARSVDFAATAVGSSAQAQTIALTNNGGLPLAIQSIAVTGDFALLAGTNTCGTSLVANAACTMQLAFAPSAAGARTGSLTVVDNAAGSPHSLQLTGTGIDFTLTPNGNTTATVSSGTSAVYPLLLSSIAGVPGSLTFTCSPIPAHATCVVNPATPSLGGTTTISVTIATSVAGAELRWPQLPGTGPGVWVVGLLPFGLMALRRSVRPRLRSVALLACLIVAVGCGASRVIPATSTTGGGGTSTAPTPPGTYNLTVAGTSAGLTRSVGLTLIVQ